MRISDWSSDVCSSDLLELIAKADVVVENFRPGVARRIGLDIEKITASRPQLIWASISGFGQTGPDSTKPAYDMIVQALSGVMSITGEVGRPSVRLGIPAGDQVAGLRLEGRRVGEEGGSRGKSRW